MRTCVSVSQDYSIIVGVNVNPPIEYEPCMANEFKCSLKLHSLLIGALHVCNVIDASMYLII